MVQETTTDDFPIIMKTEQQQWGSWETGIIYIDHKIYFNGENRELSNKICHYLIAIIVH